MACRALYGSRESGQPRNDGRFQFSILLAAGNSSRYLVNGFLAGASTLMFLR